MCSLKQFLPPLEDFFKVPTPFPHHVFLIFPFLDTKYVPPTLKVSWDTPPCGINLAHVCLLVICFLLPYMAVLYKFIRRLYDATAF